MMVLYKLDLLPVPVDDAVADFAGEHGFDLPEYAARLVRGVVERRSEIDDAISTHLQEWTIGRLGAIERSILRLAVFEILEGLVPHEVAIDEAVDLTRRY